MSHVRAGAERPAADPSLAGGARLGLITNPTGILPDLTRTPDALPAAGLGSLSRCLESGADPRDLCPPPGRPRDGLLNT
ncbi:hypothetical protein ABGB18_02690 [Nonomuraea sp. B12E4]|uniref:hypothetical protein n=1 Tax=Nonomuraea sp. B12E4 TaxID=3153564 RepID=UPI00325E4267